MSLSNKPKINILHIPYTNLSMTKEEFYPYLTYIHDGKPKDIMFTSFLFDLSVGDILAEWEAHLDAFFGVDGAANSLDSAFGDVKDIYELPLSFKGNVYISAPVPKVSLKPFGDINRDGITEKLLDNDDCLRAYELFVSSFLRRFSAFGLKNIAIDGFIWNSVDNEEFIIGANEILHKYGYKSLVINNNTEKMMSLGFDKTIGESDKVVLKQDTDFLLLNNNFGETCIYYNSEPNFLLNCALSVEGIRGIYDSLYSFLYTVEPEIESTAKPKDIPEEITENIPEEITEKITNEEYIVPEAVIAETPVYEIPCEPEIFEEVLDGTANDKIFLQDVPLEPKKKKKPDNSNRVSKKISEDKKRILIGAGIAAAALGIAYIIRKTKD